MPRTLVFGRSPFADVVIADATVAPHHLELVIADNGRLHATDCATPSGTWRLLPSEAGDDKPATGAANSGVLGRVTAGAPGGGVTGGATIGDAAAWGRLRQAFVTPETSLRLGDYRCTVADLLARARSRPAAAERGDAAGDGWLPVGRRAMAARGRVERDAHTGEIVRRRP